MENRDWGTSDVLSFVLGSFRMLPRGQCVSASSTSGDITTSPQNIRRHAAAGTARSIPRCPATVPPILKDLPQCQDRTGHARNGFPTSGDSPMWEAGNWVVGFRHSCSLFTIAPKVGSIVLHNRLPKLVGARYGATLALTESRALTPNTIR